MSTATQPTTHAPGESRAASRPLGWYGMVFFIASEAVFFANLIASYLYLRVRAGSTWPSVHVDQTLAVINTLILVSSSVTLHMGMLAINRGDKAGLRRWLLPTILLGATFICIQLYEYHANGFGPSTNIYGSDFYTLTGFHGAHVTVGVLVLAVCYFRSLRGDFTQEKHFTLTAAEMYWHFVDVVWIILVSLLYFVVR
ncbi:MAG: heme-copper oxidase subunit III [Ktedonobacterales bacterium]